jgi:ubiquinone/menaquinone biosynthesis C-methylase UbiE
VAVGTGRNFGRYPEELRLHGVDLTPSMLEIACNRAVKEGLEADLREGDAQEPPFSGESFDCMVSTLSLYSLPDQRLALAVRCPGSCALGDGCC